ncbi:N-acetylmuramoyl-L-alanine amidase [Fortiea contorta]|uniref:N-acetylmuramoyl-L-alanine amidase n=1 Tax=Fortiea contorta TaxID=1892405 RepID=UPI0003829810|nr:peptidoglycan recognition family protein [Fortiea contorta]
MKFGDWATRIILISLLLMAMAATLLIGRATKLQIQTAQPDPAIISWNQNPPVQFQSAKTQAEVSAKTSKPPTKTNSPVKNNQTPVRYKTTTAFAQYRPRLEMATVDPSNYGERFAQNANGVFFNNEPIVVIHETSNSASSAVNFFQTPHDDESVQASYHSLVKLDGTIVYLVPPDKRAFGAGDSVFVGANGIETVQTNPNLPPSVNNFAYHVSLETPPDAWGLNNIKGHSGYTEPQYNSLAWLIAQSQIPIERITTHRGVDRSGRKVDPLSFDGDKFLNLLRSFRQAISIK